MSETTTLGEFHTWALSGILAVMVAGPVLNYEIGPVRIRSWDILLVILTLYVVSNNKKLDLPRHTVWLIAPLVLLFVYSTISAVFLGTTSEDTIVELIELSEIIFSLIILSSIIIQDNKNILNFFLYNVFIITVLGSIIGIFYYIFIGERFVGVPLVFGFPAMAVYYGISVYLQTHDKFMILGTTAVLIRIIFSQTRSLWIFLPLSGIVAVLFLRNRENTYFVREKLIELGIIPVLISPVLLIPEIQSRILSIVEASGRLLARLVIYYIGVSLFIEEPLGVGLGNFLNAAQEALRHNKIVYPDWFTRIVGQSLIRHVSSRIQQGFTGPHSDFFKILSETGIFGVILYLLFILIIIRVVLTIDLDKWNVVLGASVIFILLQSTVGIVLLGGGGINIVILLSFYTTR